MEELIEKIEALKICLDNTEEVRNIKSLNLKVIENKELLNKIKLYNQTKKESLKEEITSNELYKEYKKAETELNILILQINSKLKKISNKGKCGT